MTHHPPNRLAWVLDGEGQAISPRLTLMHLPDGEPMLLQGVSALIWLLACETSDVPQALSEIVGRPAVDIVVETEAFLAELVARGLLIPTVETGQAVE